MATSVTGQFEDARPRDRALTLLIATLVTAAISVPLLFAALDARETEPAVDDGVTLRLLEGSVRADGASFAQGATATLALEDPSFLAAAWALHETEGGLVAQGNDDSRPLLVDHELQSLEPGSYDLLLTITLRDGSVVNRAARFTVDT